MNWLAHLFLSEHNVENRLGNLLGDLVKGSERQHLDFCLQRGIKCHQVIDSFTDSHFVVQRSKKLISSDYRRFAGVFVDIFYDHFLAKNWHLYSNLPLEHFTMEIYKSFQEYQGDIPPAVRELITYMAFEDWLGSYRTLKGVEKTLWRISKRLSRRLNRTFELQHGIRELTSNYNKLENDFLEFFPDLLEHVKNWQFAY